MNHQANIARIRAVSNALGALKEKVVFVGGATVSLYADRAATEVRPTDDVDIVVEITNYGAYAQLEEQLRKIGFRNDMTGKFAGRYLTRGIIVDVMPTPFPANTHSFRSYRSRMVAKQKCLTAV
jgi:hypothetical protein